MGIGVEITVEQEGDLYVVTLDGRLDATTTSVVEKKLAKVMEIAQKVAIDCSKITYLSSAGMRFFLSASKKMDAKSGKIAFFLMSDDVLEIIRMAGFERILSICKTKKEATKFCES